MKLTGRVGDFNIGTLAIRQEAFGDITAKDLFVARGSYNVLDEVVRSLQRRRAGGELRLDVAALAGTGSG